VFSPSRIPKGRFEQIGFMESKQLDVSPSLSRSLWDGIPQRRRMEFGEVKSGYFYKANWNSEPMVRIASHAATPRTKALTEVKVYSNCAEVELIVNAKSAGRAKPDAIKVCRWPDIALQPGRNTIQARANGEKLSDSCEWTLEKPNL
jgi:hypothetical protein